MTSRRWTSHVVTGIVLSLVLMMTLAVATVPPLRWRAALVADKLLGRTIDITWPELLHMLPPGSGFWLAPLAENPNPYSSISNHFTSPEDLAAGQALYTEVCAGCHGTDGMGGGTGIRLVGHTPRRGRSAWALYRTIRYGIEGTAMVPRPNLPWTGTWQLLAHVETLLQGTAGQAGNTLPALMDGFRPVAPAEIPARNGAGADWLTYSGSHDGIRYSTLDQIDAGNVATLRVAWIRQLPGEGSRGESSPIVRDGVMFITEPQGTVRALDATTGENLWSWSRDIPDDVFVCCWVTNRGVAIGGERIFVGTMDAHLVALDARTGSKVWETEVADHRDGYSITAAPLVVDDLVLTGMAGGEYGNRGFLDAYDPATGERRWRFWTIPEAGERGGETWELPSGKRMGGPTWITGSVDRDLGLLYWGVGNPTPVLSGEGRPGDNLYTNSMIALDLHTGNLRWHFQFTPHDEHDWDSNHVPVLVDAPGPGGAGRLLANANRNAFYYLLDRETGRFLLGREFSRQTWAYGLTPEGRPMEVPGQRPTLEGVLTFPAANGATNWWSPSFSPRTGLYYVPYIEKGGIFFRGEDPDERNHQGELMGSTIIDGAGMKHVQGVRALNPLTGERVWQHQTDPRFEASEIAGVLSTAGGVVFGGDNFTFYGLDDRTGARLWSIPLGALISAAPVSYSVGGRQYVAVVAGRSVIAFSLPEAADGA